MSIGIPVTMKEAVLYAELLGDFFDLHQRDPSDGETRALVAAAKSMLADKAAVDATVAHRLRRIINQAREAEAEQPWPTEQ